MYRAKLVAKRADHLLRRQVGDAVMTATGETEDDAKRRLDQRIYPAGAYGTCRVPYVGRFCDNFETRVEPVDG